MKLKKVRFDSNVKNWDGICYKSKFIEDFILTFSTYNLKYINKHTVFNYIKKYSTATNPYKENLEILFAHISELIKNIKRVSPGEKIPFLPCGGKNRIKFLTSNNLQFLDHIDNVLIELVFT